MQSGSIENTVTFHLRMQVTDIDGNTAGVRPRFSAGTVTVDPPAPPALGAIPIDLDVGGLSYDVSFTDVLPDSAGQPGLYRVVVTDSAGKRWVVWRTDRPDASGSEAIVHLPFVAAGTTFPLAAGDLHCQISAFAWPTFDALAELPVDRRRARVRAVRLLDFADGHAALMLSSGRRSLESAAATPRSIRGDDRWTVRAGPIRRITTVSARHHLSLLSLVCLAAACNRMPVHHGVDVESPKSSSLEQRSPIDVAVAPITDNSGNTALPRAELRTAFQGALVKRRYSPLALEMVDKKVVNASYRPGSLEEQAVFSLTVERWDTHLWDTRNVIEVTLLARMLDPNNPAGELWSGRLEKRFDFTDVHERFTTTAALTRYACETVAAELLAAMPVREPKPGAAKP